MAKTILVPGRHGSQKGPRDKKVEKKITENSRTDINTLRV
jgi:hypothetical protein